MIEIKVERKPLNGNLGYLIKSFKALPEVWLPKEYVADVPCLYLSRIESPGIRSSGTLIIRSEGYQFPTERAGKSGQYNFADCRGPLSNEITLHVGTWVCEETWRRICETVNEAGNRLKKIRDEVKRIERLNKALAENWNGTKVYKW